MKKNLLLTGLVTLMTLPAFAKSIPAGTYTIDTAHSKIGFEATHLVIATVEGRFKKFEGTIVIDEKLSKSKANLDVDVASLDTDNTQRDDHLKSPDFFDAANSPKLLFVTKKIVGSADKLKIVGDLTIKGKTKEVALDVKYLGDVNDAYGNHKVVFSAEGKINRKDFGLNWSSMVEAGPVVGDQIKLTIKIEANQPVAPKKG